MISKIEQIAKDYAAKKNHSLDILVSDCFEDGANWMIETCLEILRETNYQNESIIYAVEQIASLRKRK